MKKLALALLCAVAALAVVPSLGAQRQSAKAQDAELPNVFLINPNVCLALAPSVSVQLTCVKGMGNTLPSQDIMYQQASRDLWSADVFDLNDDGEVTKEEVNRLVPFSGAGTAASPTQLHQDDGALVLVAFVKNDNRIAFRTDSGRFHVDSTTLAKDFVCDQPPGADTLVSDEDCDGDGIEGDGVVYAHLKGNGDDRGPGTIEVYDATNGDVIGDAFYNIVGEPDSVSAGPFETTLQAGLPPEDCTLPSGASGFVDALGLPEKTIIFGTVKDDDATPITGAWITWVSSDEEVLKVASPTSPTLDLGSFGVAAPNILCGIGPGTATLTLKLVNGAQLGTQIFTLDLGAETEEVDVDIKVLDIPDSMALSVTPASINCNGTNTAEVAASVSNANGDPVVNGTQVEFKVVALGTLSPRLAVTTDGIAKTTVTPLSSDLAGVTILATVPRGPATFPLDENHDGVDNNNNGVIDEGSDGIDNNANTLVDEPAEFEVDVSERVPNTDTFQSSIVVACAAGGAAAGGGTPAAGGGTSGGGTRPGGGVIGGPDTGSGGFGEGRGAMPVWPAVALFVAAMGLVGARLAVRRLD